MKNDSKGNASNSNATSLPAVRSLPAGGKEDISTESQGVSRREAKQDHLGSQDAGGQVSRSTVDTLEVILLTARSRNCEAKFKEHAETAKGEESADHPEHETNSDRPSCRENTRRRGKNYLVSRVLTLKDYSLPVPIILFKIKKTAPVMPILRSSE